MSEMVAEPAGLARGAEHFALQELMLVGCDRCIRVRRTAAAAAITLCGPCSRMEGGRYVVRLIMARNWWPIDQGIAGYLFDRAPEVPWLVVTFKGVAPGGHRAGYLNSQLPAMSNVMREAHWQQRSKQDESLVFFTMRDTALLLEVGTVLRKHGHNATGGKGYRKIDWPKFIRLTGYDAEVRGAAAAAARLSFVHPNGDGWNFTADEAAALANGYAEFIRAQWPAVVVLNQNEKSRKPRKA